MPVQNKIRFAVVGCGHIGKRHAQMICENEESELVALVDTLPASELGIAHFKVPFFSSLEELLASEEEQSVDVVNIATPNGLHARHALMCLDAQKHVVIEKPMTLSRSDAEAIIYRALQESRNVFTVMQNRYSPPIRWMKHLIGDKVLGKIFMVQMNCYWNRDDRYYLPECWHGKRELDGGTLFTQFSHFIDIMYWLFGDITDIEGRFNDFNHQTLTDFEDSGLVNFNFVNGGMGCLNYSTAIWQQNMESSITVIAENGCVRIGGQYMDTVEYCRVKDYIMPELPPTNPGNDYGHYKGSATNHHFVIANVVDVLKHRSSISTNALEGLKVVDIIERIYNCRD